VGASLSLATVADLYFVRLWQGTTATWIRWRSSSCQTHQSSLLSVGFVGFITFRSFKTLKIVPRLSIDWSIQTKELCSIHSLFCFWKYKAKKRLFVESMNRGGGFSVLPICVLIEKTKRQRRQLFTPLHSNTKIIIIKPWHSRPFHSKASCSRRRQNVRGSVWERSKQQTFPSKGR
jgi:hypothetical protein